jgi:phosphatidylglycerophosphate synthase
MAELAPDLSALSPRVPLHQALAPATRLALAALAGLPLSAGAALLMAGPDPVAIGAGGLAYLVGAALATRRIRRGYPHATLGLCNVVTLTRLALAAALLAPLWTAAAPWAVFAVAVLALSLDGVDGWLARRQGRVSEFGARFDMEVDSAFALILAFNAWASGSAGAVVLLIGLPRYAFAAAGLAFPWLSRSAPERLSRKAVCVVQLVTLIALQLPPVTVGFANPLVAVVTVALIWSFGRDILWLWRSRP